MAFQSGWRSHEQTHGWDNRLARSNEVTLSRANICQSSRKIEAICRDCDEKCGEKCSCNSASLFQWLVEVGYQGCMHDGGSCLQIDSQWANSCSHSLWNLRSRQWYCCWETMCHFRLWWRHVRHLGPQYSLTTNFGKSCQWGHSSWRLRHR